MNTTIIPEMLIKKGLKVTPQRIAVMEAVIRLNNHPTADEVIEFIKKNHPNVAIGTVYKTLETFVEKALIKKVKTDRDIMRYDAIMEKHHHIYCADSEQIHDYFDDELNKLLENYFSNIKIPGFDIEDIKLQIIGRFQKK